MDSSRFDIKSLKQEDDDVADSLDNQELIEEEPVSASKRFSYRVKKGENLSLVAKKLRVSLAVLKRTNRIKGSKLKTGQLLYYYKIVSTKSYIKKKSSKRYKYSTRKKRTKKKSKKKKSKKKKSTSKNRRKRR